MADTAVSRPSAGSFVVPFRRWTGVGLPTLALLVMLAIIFWIRPAAMSYFGFTLLFKLAIPLVFAALAQMLVATGFSYDREVRHRQAESLVRLLPRVRDIRRLGSCALDLCLLASGHLDAYVEEGVNLWDHAAAALVARAAGARWELHTGASGRDLLVAAPAAAYDVFLQAVLEAGYAATPAGE